MGMGTNQPYNQPTNQATNPPTLQPPGHSGALERHSAWPKVMTQPTILVIRCYHIGLNNDTATIMINDFGINRMNDPMQRINDIIMVQ